MKTLDELAEVKRGKSRHRPRTAAALYGGPHPFIQTADIHASEFRILKCSQSYSDFGLAQSKKWKAGTLCITNAGENTGDCAILGFDACFPDSIIGITPLEGKADVRFLKYSLDLLRPQLRTVTKGATQDNLSVAILLSFPFPAPDLPTQRKIAGILSAYDDLIENNLRRIKILEEMAQSLYREWFVNFRFPGHESLEFVDSALGRIPNGWEVAPLGDLVEIRKGKNITKTTVREGSVPVVAGGLTPAYYHDTANTVAPVVTVSASGANAGFVNIYFDDAWASDCSFIDKKATPDVLRFFLLLSSRQNEVTGLQRGSAQPHVYPKDLMALEALRVPSKISDDFTRRITPLFELVRNITMRNQTLRRTRDLLLPKLISN